MKIWKHSGTLLIATGIIHNLFGFVIGWEVLFSMAQDGFFNTVTNEMDRNAIFWFIFSGFMMMLLGKLMQDYIRENKKPVPVSLGYYLLALTITGCIIMPVSGFWLVLIQSFIILANKDKAIAASA